MLIILLKQNQILPILLKTFLKVKQKTGLFSFFLTKKKLFICFPKFSNSASYIVKNDIFCSQFFQFCLDSAFKKWTFFLFCFTKLVLLQPKVQIMPILLEFCSFQKFCSFFDRIMLFRKRICFFPKMSHNAQNLLEQITPEVRTLPLCSRSYSLMSYVLARVVPFEVPTTLINLVSSLI